MKRSRFGYVGTGLYDSAHFGTTINISNRKFWQQASGDGDRNYAKLCIDWGVILNGLAGDGSWTIGGSYSKEQGYTSKKISDLKRFCKEMQNSDLAILRQGTKSAVAVGQIIGDYEYHEEFNDWMDGT